MTRTLSPRSALPLFSAFSLFLPLSALAQTSNPDPPQGAYPQAPQQTAPQYPPGSYPQYPQPGYPPAPTQNYPQQGYPQGYPQYPQGGYPQYPQSGYPQYPQGYPQYPQGAYPPAGYPQYPQPNAQQPAPAPQQPPAAAAAAPPAETKLSFSAASDEAKTALLACIDAVDNYRTESARQRCADAAAKDPQLALAYALLASVAPSPAAAQKRVTEAQEALGKRPPGDAERLYIEAVLAQVEDRRPAARAALDALVQQLPAERRGYLGRGLFRYRVGDLDGALADLQKATELDAKFGPAWNAIGHLQLRRDKLDEAAKAFEKYVEAQPKEANAHDSMSALHLRRGELGPAVDSARKALELDGKFVRANLRLGDALLLQGNPAAARRAYAALMASADPAEHHEGALRTARSRLFEAPQAPTAKLMTDAEKDLQTEVDLARKLGRRVDEARALLELGRVQSERGALEAAGRTAQAMRDLLDDKPRDEDKKDDDAKAGDAKAASADKAQPRLREDEKARFGAELLVLRALLLAGVGERDLAEERAAELDKMRAPLGPQRAKELRGDLAARAGERASVVKFLEGSQRPTAKLALAFALGGGKAGEQLDAARARTLMEELGKRTVVDLEGALTRGRARAWLKANPEPKDGAKDGGKENAKEGGKAAPAPAEAQEKLL